MGSRMHALTRDGEEQPMANAHRRFLGADDLQELLRRSGVDAPLTGHALLVGGTSTASTG